jgi:hypothetical protein
MERELILSEEMIEDGREPPEIQWRPGSFIEVSLPLFLSIRRRSVRRYVEEVE